MSLLDRLPARLQWLRGPVGSIVAHWGVAVAGSVLGHWLAGWWFNSGAGAEIGAVVMFGFFGVREWMQWWLMTETVEGIAGDMIGPTANMLYVLAL